MRAMLDEPMDYQQKYTTEFFGVLPFRNDSTAFSFHIVWIFCGLREVGCFLAYS